MSTGNPERFPWGSNAPTRRQRITVALAIGTFAVLVLLYRFTQHPADKVDFDLVWFGARTLLQGGDPYPLVGPGNVFQWDFPLLYPATSLVAVIPFALISMRHGALAFTFIGSSLLGYGATRDGWHRLPMFASAAFMDTTVGAQWSSLLVAALFLPSLAAIACAKPQLGLAVLAGSTSRRSITAAIAGGMVLVAVSFVLLPGWFGEWLSKVATADHMKAALLQPGGFLIALVLLRWRRPESWVVLLSAALPQTLMWYSFLILLAFPRTYREACILSLISSGGYLAVRILADILPPIESTGALLWGIVVFTAFMPVVVAILRRPNESEHPAWMSILARAPRNPMSTPAAS